MPNLAEPTLNRSPRPRAGRAAGWWLLALCLALVPLGTPPAAAQDEAASAATDTSGLRAAVAHDFEILPIRDGVLLRPHGEFRGVRTIELVGSTIAINGETESREVVRGWLGERADLVLRLADLAPAERRRTLGLEGTGAPPAGPGAEPGEAAEAPEPLEPPSAAGAEAPQGGAGSALPDEAAQARQEEAARSAGHPAEIPVPPPPPIPEEPRHRSHRGGHTSFGGSVYVEPDEVVDDVVVFGGSVTVEGRVEGDVVVIGGSIDIDGEVTRDVTVVGGTINLGPSSRVGGDVNAIGGAVHRSPGAEIGGRVEEVEHGLSPWWRTGPWTWRHHWSPWRMWDIAWPLAGLVILALLVALIVAVGRRPVERIALRAGREPLKSGIVGLLVAIFTVPVVVIVCVILAVTVIGIPVMVIFLLLFIFVGIPAFFVFSLVGYSAVALRVGQWAEGRFGWRLESPLVAAVVGVFVLGILGLIGDFLGVFGGAVSVFSLMFGLVGGILQLFAWAVGFGALFVVYYERRSLERGRMPAAAARAARAGDSAARRGAGHARGASAGRGASGTLRTGVSRRSGGDTSARWRPLGVGRGSRGYGGHPVRTGGGRAARAAAFRPPGAAPPPRAGARRAGCSAAGCGGSSPPGRAPWGRPPAPPGVRRG